MDWVDQCTPEELEAHISIACRREHHRFETIWRAGDILRTLRIVGFMGHRPIFESIEEAMRWSHPEAVKEGENWRVGKHLYQYAELVQVICNLMGEPVGYM